MSIRIMTQVWEIDLPDSQKIVLLALADCANDEGVAWPSMATLTRKCSKGERTVQGVIKQLVAAGLLERQERPGHGCTYTINPRSDCTPAETAPRRRRAPQRLRDTPAETAGHPRSGCGQSVIEPSGTVSGGTAPDLPDGPGSTSTEPEAQPAKVRAHPLPADWTPPPVSALSPAVQALVAQWPAGAYEAVCETFRLHWHSETRAIGRKINWLAALGKWLTNDHSKVMRDARAGVSFAALAPAATSGQRAAPIRPTPAKEREDQWSLTIHAILRRAIGDAAADQWMTPTALLLGDDGGQGYGLTVIAASEFQRKFIEERFAPDLGKAVRGAIGEAPRWVRFDVERAAAKELIDG